MTAEEAAQRQWSRRKADPECPCCHGRGQVQALRPTDGLRPCSRCRVEDFHNWYSRAVAAEKPANQVPAHGQR